MTEIKNPGIPYMHIPFYRSIIELSIYQPALGNERINTKTNKYKVYTYFVILFCIFVFCLIKNQYN